MLNIGCHLGCSLGYAHMAKEAISIGANTFQFFTRNPRGGDAKAIDSKDIENFLRIANDFHFTKIVAHAPYTLNLCSDKPFIRKFALDTFKDDLKRMEYTPNNYYNFHPGNHVGQGEEIAIQYVIDALNEAIEETQTTTVLIETMSGKGSEIGKTFQEVKKIIDGVKLKSHIGVCLDTCHVSDAGYDVINNFDKVLDEFDEIIGLSYLKAIHLNDSMNPCGSHKDRHQKIGEGYIGLESITKIINNERVKHLPFILETPNDLDGYKKEIALLKSVYKD